MSTVYCSNLPYNAKDTDLEAHFSKYGEITDRWVVYRGKRSRGFGFVTFTSADQAKKALASNDAELTPAAEGSEGRAISVVMANPRSEEDEAAAKARIAERAAKPKGEKPEKKEKKPKAAAAPKKEKLPDDVWEAMSVEERKAHAKKMREARPPKAAKADAPKKEKLPDDVWEAMSVEERKAHAKKMREARPKKAKDGEEAKGAKGEAEKKKPRDEVNYNISPEQLAFLQSIATKYEVKGLNRVTKALLAFAKDDEDNEVFAKVPPKPEKFSRLKLVLDADEKALLAKADAHFEYANRHLAVQAMIKYVTPEGDAAEKAAAENMLDEIFKKKGGGD